MLLSQYAKQAWHQARTNVTYTVLYVAGVMLAMMFTMTMAMVLYVRIAPVYPETKRCNTSYINNIMLRNDRSSMSGRVSQYPYDEWLSKLENVEHIALYCKSSRSFAKSTDGTPDFEISVKFVRGDFFKIYDFALVAGRMFTDEEAVAENPRAAIITERLAERLFGGAEQAIGQTVTVDRYDNLVVGVVRGASVLTKDSYAQMYRPMGQEYYGENGPGVRTFTGANTVVITTRDASQAKDLDEEIKTLIHKINNSDIMVDPEGKRWELQITDQPVPHWRNVVSPNPTWGDASNNMIWIIVVILLVLLIVPAINLSGLIGGRMDTRLSELGIRKTYGATRTSLLRQVMFENLLLTLVGAVLGMIGAWILVTSCRRWIFSIFDPNPVQIAEWSDVAVNPDMLFAPALFVVMLVVCLTVNLLSATVPAWLYMRKPIVSSLYEKR